MLSGLPCISYQFIKNKKIYVAFYLQNFQQFNNLTIWQFGLSGEKGNALLEKLGDMPPLKKCRDKLLVLSYLIFNSRPKTDLVCGAIYLCKFLKYFFLRRKFKSGHQIPPCRSFNYLPSPHPGKYRKLPLLCSLVICLRTII